MENGGLKDRQASGTTENGLPLLGKEARWLRSILESLPVGVITLDRDWRITSFNKAAEIITGYPQGQVLGRSCYRLFRTPVCQGDCPMERAWTCSTAVYDREVSFTNRLHRRIQLSGFLV